MLAITPFGSTIHPAASTIYPEGISVATPRVAQRTLGMPHRVFAGTFIKPNFFIFLYNVTRLIPNESAARLRL